MFKRLITVLLAAAVCLLAAGCGDEAPAPSAHYETVLDTLTASVKLKDTDAYLLCFTEAARLRYKNSDEYSKELTAKLIPSDDGEQAGLVCRVAEHRELETAEVSALEEAYKAKYAMRIDITKAYEIRAEFTSGRNSTEKTLNVVNDGTGWLIMGPVIEKFFGTETAASGSDSSR